MRRWIILSLLLGACGSDQSLEYDLDPILLSRAPVVPGGAKLGGLLALVTTSSGLRPLLVDTAFPYSSLARGDCPSTAAPGWTYGGNMDLHDPTTPGTPLRADFTNVGLFDICPGASGDPSAQPFGVMGGPLLTNFSAEFAFPRDEAEPASMMLWPSFPGSDDQLAQDGRVVLHFDLRGSFTVAQGNGASALTLPNSRVVLAACAGPRAFATTQPAETCAHGEAGVRASGEDLMLAIGTGEGPTILSQSAWARLAPTLGLATDSGAAGQLYTPFSAKPIPALFVSLPEVALLQGITDSNWLGPCAELARARRIEWVLANQSNGACFQPCDVSGDVPLSTHPYLDLGGALLAAIVPDTSDVILSLNADVAAKPRVDGILGAASMAGARVRIDYQAEPQGRVIASCLDGETRGACFAAPGCPGLSQGQDHVCFGQQWHRTAPVCQQP
jgi:hypothetical protein